MKFISENAASKATPSKVIKYIMNPEKCCKDENGEILIATIGLDDDRPYSQQFRETAELAGNDYQFDDRKLYHFKYTVSPDDYDPDGEKNITPEQLLHKAEDFVREKLPGYQAIITVQYHNNGLQGDQQNEKHLHAHIVVNASSYDPEMNKLDLRNSDLDELRDRAYEDGLEFGLHERYWRDEVAEKLDRATAERQRADGNEAANITAGERVIIDKYGKNFSDYSWKEQYRIAIDEAKAETTSLDTFREYLQEHFNISTEVTKQGNIKYKSPGRNTYTMGKTLGADYTLDAVMQGLEETKARPSDLPKEPTAQQIRAAEWVDKFHEEYDKLQKWEEEYRKQQAEGLGRAGDSEAQYRQDKLILENTQAFYKLCQDAANDEVLMASLTDKERQLIEAMERERLRLAHREEEEAYRKRIDEEYRNFLAFRQEMRRQYQDDISENYEILKDSNKVVRDCAQIILHSNSLFVSLVAFGVAMREIDKEKRVAEEIQYLKNERADLMRNTRTPDTFYAAYKDDIDAGKMPGLVHADKVVDAYERYGRELVREKYISTLRDTGTSLEDRIAAANGLRDMNVQEGRTKDYRTQAQEIYGRDTRRHPINEADARAARQIQDQMNVMRVVHELGANNCVELELKVKQAGRAYGKIKREYNAAKKQFDETVASATAEIANNETLSLEEKARQIEQVVKTESRKLKPIEEQFKTAKADYARYAKAIDTLHLDTIRLEIASEQREAERQSAEQGESVEPKKEAEEPQRRSKAEAERETQKQWSELRDWTDEAIAAVAQKPGAGKDGDMKAWAEEMEKRGCQIRITANTISIKHPDASQAVRSNRLGYNYQKEEIANGISVSRESSRRREAERSGSADRTGEAQRDSRAPERSGRTEGPGRERGKERVRERDDR